MAITLESLAFPVAGLLALVALGLWWRARRMLARLVRTSGRIVHDDGNLVELWFDPGLAVVRNRAFSRDEDRREFIEAVTKRIGAKA